MSFSRTPSGRISGSGLYLDRPKPPPAAMPREKSPRITKTIRNSQNSDNTLLTLSTGILNPESREKRRVARLQVSEQLNRTSALSKLDFQESRNRNSFPPLVTTKRYGTNLVSNDTFNFASMSIESDDIKPQHAELRQLLAAPFSRSFSEIQRQSETVLYGGKGGLRNLGNTCFMNSILQCLFSIKPLVGYFQSNEYQKQLSNKRSLSGHVAKSFADLVHDFIGLRDNGVISPIQFKRQIQMRAPQFEGNDQHDAQEFLRILVEALHSDLNKIDKPPRYTYTDKEFDKLNNQDKALISWNRYLQYEDSFIFSIFGGQLESTITCQHCQNQSTTFEIFWDLSVPLLSKSNITLNDCINEFFKEELLDDYYNCSTCKTPRKSSKKLSIYQFPAILVIHLKRFKAAGYGFRRDGKVNSPVTIPTENLEISHVVSQIRGSDTNAKYNLLAVSNHFGNLYGGHYTALTKSLAGNEWLDRNDSHVSQGRLNSEAAYILFYERSV